MGCRSCRGSAGPVDTPTPSPKILDSTHPLPSLSGVSGGDGEVVMFGSEGQVGPVLVYWVCGREIGAPRGDP